MTSPRSPTTASQWLAGLLTAIYDPNGTGRARRLRRRENIRDASTQSPVRETVLHRCVNGEFVEDIRPEVDLQ